MIENKEQLLTDLEIELILQFVDGTPEMRHPDLMTIGINKTDVIKVTPNGVIIIQGDKHTGFKHVHERHNFYSEKTYWKVVDGEIKIDNPSLFSIKSLPIVDYANIADKLYDPNYLDIAKNKRPDVLDYYIGEVDDVNNGKQQYILLTYKDTPILHSLFPRSKTHNASNKGYKILPFRRGDMSGEFNPESVRIGIPYFDIHGKIKYSFEIWKLIEENIELGVIRDIELDGHIELYRRELPKDFSFEDKDFYVEMNTIYYSDLTPIEKEIKKYHDWKTKESQT